MQMIGKLTYCTGDQRLFEFILCRNNLNNLALHQLFITASFLGVNMFGLFVDNNFLGVIILGAG